MRSEARIIDANANRAAEGLRTLEDIARFALNNERLSEDCKEARHDLAGAVRTLPIPAGLRVTVRDTPNDVGTGISTPSERDRPGLASIVAAASGRTTEAIRTLEEMAKAIGGEAGACEKIRYRVYELDRRIATGLVPASPQWRLCVLITASLCRNNDWAATAQAAIAGGADCLQLREKSLTDRELLTRARRLVEIAGARASVVINDRPDIALLARANAVHVGQGDLSPADVRAVSGAGMPVGVSTSTIEQAVHARAAGASSVGLGPMFPTTTAHKPEIAGLAYLRAFLADVRVRALPHLCIGGITPDNAPELSASGARGLAVSSAVCGAADPEAACRAILRAVTASPSPAG